MYDVGAGSAKSRSPKKGRLSIEATIKQSVAAPEIAFAILFGRVPPSSQLRVLCPTLPPQIGLGLDSRPDQQKRGIHVFDLNQNKI